MMTGHGAKLPRKMDAAIAALMTHSTIEQAAKSINISSKTLRRWLKLPEFREEMTRAVRPLVTMAYARLQHHAPTATAVLLQSMVNPQPNASVRMKAGRSVLELSMKGYERDDMETRLARVEELTKKQPTLDSLSVPEGTDGDDRV